jgi:hypothetical protein
METSANPLHRRYVTFPLLLHDQVKSRVFTIISRMLHTSA